MQDGVGELSAMNSYLPWGIPLHRQQVDQSAS